MTAEKQLGQNAPQATAEARCSRRSFLSKAATVGAAAVIAPSVLGCASGKETPIKDPAFPFLDKAPEGKKVKAAVIGCGGRGSGAAINFLNAGDNLEIVAIADVFQDKLDSFRKKLKKEKGVEIPDDRCYLGFDAYEKVMAGDADVVILTTPPVFRPQHIAAAVAARKHVFAEKPVCVDPVGARSCMVSALKAKELGLSIVTGTQRRHQRNYQTIKTLVDQGAIGQITGGNVYWNGGKLWHRDPQPEWSEMESMIRDWVNWSWLSGDHIVEQHVHNIDVFNWFMNGAHPVKAVGFGSRQRRVTGDQFDNFSVDFEYENGIHLHSMCRQMNGCANNVSEWIMGTKGCTNAHGFIQNLQGEKIWRYKDYCDGLGLTKEQAEKDPYVQEHVDLITAIRTNQPFNELEENAKSTLAGIMGRVSAYTGKAVTWDEMLNSDLKLGPKVYVMGPVEGISKTVPVPGEAFIPKK